MEEQNRVSKMEICLFRPIFDFCFQFLQMNWNHEMRPIQPKSDGVTNTTQQNEKYK